MIGIFLVIVVIAPILYFIFSYRKKDERGKVSTDLPLPFRISSLGSEPILDPPNFIGREDELFKLKENLRYKSVIIIKGKEGVGKTSLGAKFCKELSSDYSTFWYTACEDTDIEGIFLKLNQFLEQKGDRFFSQIFILPEIEIKGKIDLLIKRLEKKRYILFIDNYHLIMDNRVFHMIDRFSKELNVSKVVIITSEKLTLAQDKIFELELQGFNLNDSILFLKTCGLEKGDLEKISNKFQGNPLALKLIASEKDARSVFDEVSGRNIRDIIDIRYNRLNEDERNLISRLSVFNEEVPFEACKYLYKRTNLLKIIKDLESLALITEHNGNYSLHSEIRDLCYEKLFQKERYHKAAAKYYGDANAALKEKRMEAVLEESHHYFKAEDYSSSLDLLISNLNQMVLGGYSSLLYARLLKFKRSNLTDKEWLKVSQAKGEINNFRGFFDEAISNFTEMLRIAENGKSRNDLSLSYHGLGSAYRLKGDLNQAISYYERSLRVFEEEEPIKRESPVYRQSFGSVYKGRGRWDEGIRYYIGYRKRDFDLHEESNIIAIIYADLGLIYLKKGEFEQAISCFEKGLDFSLKEEDLIGKVISITDLGVAYHLMEEYDRAISYYEESLSLWKEIGNVNRTGSIYNNLGTIYQNKREMEQAIKNFENSLEIWRRIGNLFEEAEVLRSLGAIYEKIGDYLKAIDYYKKSIEIFENIGREDELPSLYEKINIATEILEKERKKG
ncbi:MAG: tetratricopeptide repeat protein [bacterium]|nr:tetratricopeptide repeat protein [bacterium]